MNESPRSLSKATLRTARHLAFAAFCWYALSGGGRIVGSDEVTMLELSRAMLSGRIDVPAGATLQGRGGLHYTKNAPGQAILAAPLVAVAEGVCRAAGLEPGRRTLALRFVVSFFNAAVTAVLLGVFYLFTRWLGVGASAAMLATLLLGLTTPLWVYAKSFMAEPLQALGVLLTVWGVLRVRDHPTWSWMVASGFLLAVLVKPSMAPLAGGAMAFLWFGRLRGFFIVLGVAALAALPLLAYNVARFGTPLETGYGAQASAAGFSTPFWVGIYGLLLSSGKGLLWFAPVLWIAVSGARAMRQAGGTRRAAFGTIVGLSVFALGFFGSFEHWAGDGSFGPRYLLPILPLLFVVVAFALEHGSRARLRAAQWLALAGLLVQLGGVSIHFGAQMREAGDYPYTRPLDDPRFMSDSHFNPAFSPIVGNWRMLARNLGEHLTGRAPRLQMGGEGDARLGISSDDQQRLLHAIDFWWLYMLYAGVPVVAVAIAVLGLLLITLFALRGLRLAHEDEAVGG